MSILKVEHLTTGYEKKPIINDISFEIPRGAFVGIMGPNGAGKSTLFKAISKILSPWSGKILYKDKDISSLTIRAFAKQASTIPQFFEVPFSFTVEEFILMGRYPHRSRFEPLKSYDYKIAEEVITLFDIHPYRKRRISSLSGGELQRVVIAQGLAQEPELLLLDEPTSHLDIGHQIKIMDLICSLNKKRGLTVIAILHDLNLASNYCDTLVLLKEGKIFTSGSTEEVLTYQNVEHVYDTTVVVEKDPVLQKPHVFLVPSQALRDSRKS